MKPEPTVCRLLTNHAHVLLQLQKNQKQPLRMVAAELGLTERSVQLLVADLEQAGYLTRKRVGRQNEYAIHTEAFLKHPLETAYPLASILSLDTPNRAPDIEDSHSLDNWTVGEHGSEVK